MKESYCVEFHLKLYTGTASFYLKANFFCNFIALYINDVGIKNILIMMSLYLSLMTMISITSSGFTYYLYKVRKRKCESIIFSLASAFVHVASIILVSLIVRTVMITTGIPLFVVISVFFISCIFVAVMPFITLYLDKKSLSLEKKSLKNDVENIFNYKNC